MTAVAEEIPPLLALLPSELCNACVGRTFAHTEPAASNAERGRRIRPSAPDPGPACPLCEGTCARFDDYAVLCRQAAEGHEYDTFLVGSVLYAEIRRREDELYERLANAAPQFRRTTEPGKAPAPAFAHAEYLKAEVNREVGKRIEATGKKVDFSRPHITFQVDTRLDAVRLQVASVFIEGRYRKHDRTMPQTRWPCRQCGGIGCRACAYEGKTYTESVEEWVAQPFMEACGAREEAFHGMGREDIDARMLGTGRPFVLELKSPRLRTLDCSSLAARVAHLSGGRVEALDARSTDAGAPARFKAADPEKTYVAHCRSGTPIERRTLEHGVQSLEGVALEQRTPERVAHRRADLVRRRRILGLRILAHEGGRFDLEIRAESGTYIKEFVSGDEGRTKPNLSQVVGVDCRVAELDVVAIHWEAAPAQNPAAGL